MKKNRQKTFVVQEKFVYLHCQHKCIDYPVSFRVGAGPYRHRPILKVTV